MATALALDSRDLLLELHSLLKDLDPARWSVDLREVLAARLAALAGRARGR